MVIFVSLFFILFLIRMDTIFLHEDDKSNNIVEIGIIEDGGITLVSGIICFENESEILFEVEEVSEKEVKELHIYRYNKSDIKYIRKDLTS